MPAIDRLKPAHLRLLVAIGHSGKVQVAADQTGMTQPAASRIVAEIETDLGAALFERLPRGMRPTAFGDTVLAHAAMILTEYDALARDVTMLRKGLAGQVRIGAVTGPAVGLVMPALRALHDFAPQVEAIVHVAPSARLLEGLEARAFDFVIARLPAGYEMGHLDIAPARNERVALLVHHDHPLARRQHCPLESLLGFDWVMQERGAPIRQAVESAFLTAGQKLPARVTNSSSLLVALAMLAQGQAISPQAQEVADLLTRPGIGAALTVLDCATPITVAPYFVIRLRQHAASQATLRAWQEVLARL
jgi:molybdate transport repressor ModE-like protein